jgi:hypothetical protein
MRNTRLHTLLTILSAVKQHYLNSLVLHRYVSIGIGTRRGFPGPDCLRSGLSTKKTETARGQPLWNLL